MRKWVQWILGAAILTAVGVIPFAHYRSGYAHAKRLRVVTDGKVYRCGQLTAKGFEEAFRLYGIRTVINLQEESRDPLIPEGWQGDPLVPSRLRPPPSILESELCKANGVRYITLDGGVLDTPGQDTGSRPAVIDEFLAILDDKSVYPILIHCKAGLHRTGLMTAIYRMEYEGRSKESATRELRANGFGTFAATDGNDYIKRYISDFKSGVRRRGEK